MPYQEMKTLTIDGTTYEIVDDSARSSITTLQALAGAPLTANTVSAMVDTTKVYVYTGSESGYTSGNWYYWSGSAWTSGGVYNSQGIGDGTITNEKLADSTVKLEKLHSEVISAIGSGGSGTGLTDDIKQALLTCFGYVAWINDQGQSYYETLQTALYPPANLSSISAVYTQSGTVYDTDSLDDLKTDLVVTAHYDDNSTQTITTYTLSGTLTTGTSTVTVSYGGKTTTFTVTVTETSYVTDGLIHYYDAISNTSNGHDSTSTVWDDLVGTDDLTMNNSAYASWESNALMLAGDYRQYLVGSETPLTSGGHTFEVVFKTDEAQASTLVNAFSGSSNCGKAIIYSDGTFNVNGSVTTAYLNGVNAIEDFNHICGSYTGDTTVNKAYANGVPANLGDVSHSMRNDKSLVYVGVNSTTQSTAYPFKGRIYAIRVYNRILTDAEVLHNYNKDVTRYGLGV